MLPPSNVLPFLMAYHQQLTSRAALSHRNIKLKLKSAATTPLPAPQKHSTHVSRLQLNWCLGHRLALLLEQWLKSESELKRWETISHTPAGPTWPCIVRVLLLCSRIPWGQRPGLGFGDTAARNWGTQSWFVCPRGVFAHLETAESIQIVARLLCFASAQIMLQHSQ